MTPAGFLGMGLTCSEPKRDLYNALTFIISICRIGQLFKGEHTGFCPRPFQRFQGRCALWNRTEHRRMPSLRAWRVLANQEREKIDLWISYSYNTRNSPRYDTKCASLEIGWAAGFFILCCLCVDIQDWSRPESPDPQSHGQTHQWIDECIPLD